MQTIQIMMDFELKRYSYLERITKNILRYLQHLIFIILAAVIFDAHVSGIVFSIFIVLFAFIVGIQHSKIYIIKIKSIEDELHIEYFEKDVKLAITDQIGSFDIKYKDWPTSILILHNGNKIIKQEVSVKWRGKLMRKICDDFKKSSRLTSFRTDSY